jgi:hypothetical protein
MLRRASKSLGIQEYIDPVSTQASICSVGPASVAATVIGTVKVLTFGRVAPCDRPRDVFLLIDMNAFLLAR